MGTKKKFLGLRFRYKVGERILLDRYKTVEDFLHTSLSKENPLAPKGTTSIFDIYWMGYFVKANGLVKTLQDLHSALLGGNMAVLQKIIYERKEIYSIGYVYDRVRDVLFEKNKKDAVVIFDGDKVYGNSHRYQTFFNKGLKCVSCGIEGEFFAKEKKLNQPWAGYHLNLYGTDKFNSEILMTKDHIIPKSKGGSDFLENFQTMCSRCNSVKGNIIV